MHHPDGKFILDEIFNLGKIYLLIFKNLKMKKLFFCAMMGGSVMAFAKTMAIWTSSCGVKHYTTFPDGWTYNQISNAIATINEAECGVKPSVSLNLN